MPSLTSFALWQTCLQCYAGHFTTQTSTFFVICAVGIISITLRQFSFLRYATRFIKLINVTNTSSVPLLTLFVPLRTSPFFTNHFVTLTNAVSAVRAVVDLTCVTLTNAVSAVRAVVDLTSATQLYLWLTRRSRGQKNVCWGGVGRGKGKQKRTTPRASFMKCPYHALSEFF